MYYHILLATIILFLGGCASWRDIPPPSTVSLKARAFLEVARPVPDGNPSNTLEWKMRQDLYNVSLEVPGKAVRLRYPNTLVYTNIAGVNAILVTPRSVSAVHTNAILIYIHGGAYTYGSAKSTLSCAIPAAHYSGIPVLSVDYRLAPEYPFPAGLNDCTAVYQEILKHYPPRSIGIFGDSAGGALTVSTILSARDAGLPMPAAAVLLSPWADITRTGDSYVTLEGVDPILSYPKNLKLSAEVYAGENNMKHPLISPVYADFSPGFPPTLIQVGTREIFLSNAARLQRALLDAGVDARLRLWEGMWHVFQYLPPVPPEAEAAYKDLSSFFSNHLNLD